MTVIGYTLGSGIGPELFPVALQKARVPKDTKFLLCENLLQAIELANSGKIQALVTGPVHKSILQNINNKSYAGQTELLYDYLAVDSKSPLMCFVGGPFVLGLATVHVPIREVSKHITHESLTQKLERLITGTALLLGKAEHEVHVIVLGLNPHAGEDGLLGDEEQLIITPVIEEFKQKGFQIEGPVPADGFWGYGYQKGNIDAVMAMMHDQGLGPYKLLTKGIAANLTFGLKIPRASPAHGTADELVGTGMASPDSLVKAIEVLGDLTLDPLYL
ncbi:MAG: 4-hydroxythreonine-4-phosphate dehydrogenase PdxA [Myxococcaceae bacterium]